MKCLYMVESDLAKEALFFGRRNHKHFRPLPYAGDLDRPTYHNEWWFVPLVEDSSPIPAEARKRVELLRREGFEVRQLIVAHESPKLLPPPRGESAIEKRKAKWRRRRHQLKSLGSGVMVVAATVIGILIVGALTFGYTLASAVMIDPALIVVLEDGTWLEVATWYE